MESFDRIHALLLDVGFHIIELHTSNHEWMFFHKDHLFAVVRRYYGTDEMSSEPLIEEAHQLRSILLDHGFNPWNSYFLIATSADLKDDWISIVERDSTALRKYVIRNELDIARIPFLDTSPVHENPRNMVAVTTDGSSSLRIHSNDPVVVAIRKQDHLMKNLEIEHLVNELLGKENEPDA